MRVVTEAKNVQTGRSLTEMMGTLAIMGILAIAGIWMYNSAMDRLKANTIINEAQKRAVVVAGQIGFQGRTDPSLGEFSDNEFAGGTFFTDVITDGLYEQFGIQVSNVPKAVCQNILNSIGETTPMRRLSVQGNLATAMTSCAENNTFLMIYNNDMSSGGNDTTYATTDCSCQTVCGVCVVENGDTKCVNECPATGTCSSNTDCSGTCVGCVIPDGETQGTCQACQRVAYLESTGEQWIDTGFYPTQNTAVELKTPSLSADTFAGVNRWFTGGRQALNVKSFGFYYNLNGQALYYSFSTNQPYGRFVPSQLYGNERKFYADKTGLYVDNTKVVNNTITTAFISPVTLVIWGLNNNGSHTSSPKCGMYYYKVWDNGILMRDFIPVHAPFQPVGKQNCMYDKVSKALFCNAAEGDDFIID